LGGIFAGLLACGGVALIAFILVLDVRRVQNVSSGPDPTVQVVPLDPAVADRPPDVREEGAISHINEQAALRHSKLQLELFQDVLALYRLDTNSYPTTQQGLRALTECPSDLAEPSDWKGPYMRQRAPPDPWNNEFQYELLNPEDYRIWSFGPDGQDGTNDDIVMTATTN
jgi:general secretion pathway protein G